MDCNLSLTELDPLNVKHSPDLQYLAGVTEKVADFDSFFKNEDNVNCPLDNCQLFLDDCTTVYPAGGNLTFDS